ncbi:hypothetical protein [Streptococcus pantholopis]|uniref:DUF2975 domain-containing protein n=1 Tax=Streptococcus pantholopis TaxID=1811193 RepID=A0A172Q9I5_9STRE|nr:hypothetical protein [Streptococcus pantholopis]AND80110.1 hypothetical protein A0O21_08910 [Streptococcus pantholopis]
MKSTLLKVIKSVLVFFKCLAILLIYTLAVGIVGVFLGGQNSHGVFSLDYGNFTVKLPIIYPLLVLLAAMSMCLILTRIINIWIKILKNFQKDRFFCLENLKGVKKSAFLLSGLTLLHFFLNLLFNYLNVGNVSELFDLSIKNYLINIIFLAFNYLAIIVFKKSFDIQKENEEII